MENREIVEQEKEKAEIRFFRQVNVYYWGFQFFLLPSPYAEQDTDMGNQFLMGIKWLVFDIGVMVTR